MKAKRAVPSNGSRADGVVQQLIALQALAQMQIAKADERMARADERMVRADERFMELERRLTAAQDESSVRFQRLEQTMAAFMRMLEALPDALREKIGFAAAKP